MPVHTEGDIVTARHAGRALASELGFSEVDLTVIATAISELTRNIVDYAGRGEVAIRTVERGRHRGLRIVASDSGPGIVDLELAMQDGYSTGGSLGLGLPGTRRLMDEFHIESRVGEGTTVTVTKWLLP